MFGMWLVPVSQEWEPSDALKKKIKGSVPVPFALRLAGPVLGTSPLSLALAVELGQVWDRGLCFHR